MPEKEIRKQRSNVYAGHMSSDYLHKEQQSSYHGQHGNHKPRGRRERSSLDDRTISKDRQTEMRSVSCKRASLRGQCCESPPGMSKKSTMYHPDKQYYEEQQQTLYNFKYILSTRGLCQLMELFLNLIIIICAGVPYSNNGGYRDLASLGGVYYYYFGGAGAFTGVDAERVKQLDNQFHELKKPPYILLMAFAGALMIYVCAMLTLGVFRVPYRWPPVLVGECLLNILIGLGYITVVSFYFIKLQEIYNSPICKEREQMYTSKGHKGFDCQYNGGDIAGGLFSVVGVGLFLFGSVAAVKAFRSVRELKKQRADEEVGVR